MSETSTAMTGEQLREARKTMNLRQAALAEALGLTPQYIGMMERGDKAIEPRTVLSVRYLVEHPESRPGVDWEDVKTYTGSELAEEIEAAGNDVVHGREWGRWRLDTKTMTLDLDSREAIIDRTGDGEPIFGRTERYYVMLAEMTGPEQVLRWVGHIANKPWGTPTLGAFVKALNDIFHLARWAHGEKPFGSEDAVLHYLGARTQP